MFNLSNVFDFKVLVDAKIKKGEVFFDFHGFHFPSLMTMGLFLSTQKDNSALMLRDIEGKVNDGDYIIQLIMTDFCVAIEFDALSSECKYTQALLMRCVLSHINKMKNNETVFTG